MASLNHIHTYERSKTNKKVYRCVHPDCSHYDKQGNLEGKRAHCKCGEDFILHAGKPQRHFQYAVPKCEICRVTKASKEKKLVDSIVSDIFGASLKDVEIFAPLRPLAEVETVLRSPSPETPPMFEAVRNNEQTSLALADDDDDEDTPFDFGEEDD